jgi:tripartite-type tricarboxylate transporter receptor subunit TctC
LIAKVYRMRGFACLTGVLLSAVFSAGVFAQAPKPAASFPNKPVRWIVPFPPGGSTDVIARYVAQKLTETWGQTVLIENRAGASGAIGSDVVARAAPDGYTWLMGTTSTHAVSPAIQPKLPYDTVADFTAVTLVATFPNVLVVHPSAPKTLVELLAAIKANPGKYSFGSSGAGSSTHLAGELFRIMTGTQMVHAGYKGTGPLLNDLIAGHIPIAWDQITGALPHIQSGRIRVLGVASLERSPALPDVPTVAEVVPGFEAIAWVGIFAPANVPADVVSKIQSEVRRIVQAPEATQRLRDLGATAVGNTPAEFSAFVPRDTAKWKKLVQEAGIKAE